MLLLSDHGFWVISKQALARNRLRGQVGQQDFTNNVMDQKRTSGPEQSQSASRPAEIRNDLPARAASVALYPSVVSDAPHSQCVQVGPVLRGASDTTV